MKNNDDNHKGHCTFLLYNPISYRIFEVFKHQNQSNAMEILINDTKTLGEIKAEFQQHFPHLKIEFYAGSHEAGEGNSNTTLLEDHWQIAQARTVHTEGHLSINGHQKTKTLEAHFKAHYGLNVQVFRKSGNAWLQSTKTDDWTLSEQEHYSANNEALRDAQRNQEREEIDYN